MGTKCDDNVEVKLNEIQNEIKEHTKILASVDKTLALQAQQLEYHISRTNIAEDNLALLRLEFKPVQEQSQFIHKLSDFSVNTFKILASLCSIVAGVYYFVKFLVPYLT